MNQGRLALRYLERAVKLAPKVAEIHFDLAEAYLLVGKLQQARFSYETVVDLAPAESALAIKAKQRLGSIK
jgi:Flp pilus assembly protein TadD